MIKASNKLIIILFFLLSSCISNSQNININLNNVFKVSSSLGFLHNFNVTDKNLERNIQTLRPKYWRLGAGDKIYFGNNSDRQQMFDLLRKYNITPIIVVSDFIKSLNKGDKNWNTKYSSIAIIDRLLEDLYNKFGANVIYDIWNEPDIKGCWNDKEDAFNELFKHIYLKLRSFPNGNKLIITAPSLTGFNMVFLDKFLDYCNSNNIRIDILNWHENGGIKHALNIPSHINYANNVWKKKYPNVGFQKIFIPEIIGDSDSHNPLTALAFFYYIEKSGALGACKACWGKECGDNRFDGILTPQGDPRSNWWVYKLYAQSLDNRILSSSSTKLLSIASTTKSKDTLNILAGNINNSTMNVTINFSNLNALPAFSKAGNIVIAVYRIPNTNAYALKEPIKLSTSILKFKNTIRYTVPKMNNKEVYLIKVYKK